MLLLISGWYHYGAILKPRRRYAVSVNLSIKNAPATVVKRLKARAARHHRSLQGELIAILEAVANEEALLDPVTAVSELRRLGLRTPAESAAMVREDRDAR